MPDLHKGVSNQCTNQKQMAKPRHQPSDRDKWAKDRLKNKTKIKIHAYMQLGEKALQTVHQTFEPNIPVVLHLPALANITQETDTVPTLFVIQEGIHCMPTTDYFYTNIQPEPIIVSPNRRKHSEQTAQHAATKDPVSQQTNPLQPGKTRIYPSMLADKQVPVLNLTESSITSQADLQTTFESIHLCSKKDDKSSHGGEKSKEDNTEFRRRNKFLFMHIS